MGRLVVGAAALAVGIMLLLDNTNVLRVTPKGVFAVLLAIVGIGLLAGTWFGHAKWLIFPGLFLAMCLATVSFVPIHSGGFGQTAWHPRSLAELDMMCRSADPGAPCFEQTAGEAMLDLSDVEFDEEERHIDVRLSFGELLVVVPEDVNVVVDARVQGGETNLFGELDSGWDVRTTGSADGDEGIGPLEIEAMVTFGELRVIQGEPSDDPGSIPNRNGRGFDFNFDFEREMRGR